MGDWLPALIAGAAGLLAAVLSYRQATRAVHATARIELSKVDASAYERARAIYESAIGQLEEQVSRLRQEVNRERAGREALLTQVFRMERTIRWMRRQLELLGVDVPDVDLDTEQGVQP
jgi:predicted  nucleic acid-binding Zn-ribbon protein